MKKIFLFSSRLWVYATEIPVLLMLALVISVHDSATSIVKFYPLEIALVAVAVLIVLFFFRAVQITKKDIREIGRFSSREKATIEEGKRLVFTLASNKRLMVELYESADGTPSLPFAGGVCSDINLFRAKTLGNTKAVRKTLIYFGLTATEADTILSDLPAKETNFENVAVRAEKKHDVTIFHIRMLKTL